MTSATQVTRRRQNSEVVAAFNKTSWTTPKWTRSFLLGLTALLLLCLFTGEIRDTDICWHLKTGQYILQTHALPVPDPFSYTTNMSVSKYAGEEITRRVNLTHEWLSEILMYLIYSAMGFPGLVLGRAVLLASVCATVGWLAFRRNHNFYLSLASVLASAGIAFYFQQSRPFLATFVFFVATLAILETRRWMWLLPPIFLVWANCHGGFFLGWFLCAIYCAEALTKRLRKMPLPDERELWMVSIVSILVSGLNPNGFLIVRALWLYRSSEIQMNNLEWQRPIFWEPGMFSVLLFGSLVVLLLARRRTRLADWLLYLGFAALSLTAVRNTIFIAIVGPVILASYLPKWRILPSIALVLAASTLLAADVIPALKNGNVLALRLAEWQLPSGAVQFIQTHHITARMFNNYESGGYLIWRLWPMQRDFIDGRGLSEEAYEDYRKVLYASSKNHKTPEEILDKYKAQMLVLDGFDYLSGQVYPYAVELAESENTGWKLVYSDSKGVVFMQHPPAGVEALSSPQTALLESLENQCVQHILHEPFRPRCAFGLTELYAHQGNTDKAAEWISYYMQRRRGPDPEAERVSRSLTVTKLNEEALRKQSGGDTTAAEELLRRALAIADTQLGPNDPDTAGTLNNLGALLEAKGKFTEAEQSFRRTLAICEIAFGPQHPRTAASLDNLAGVLAAEGDVRGAETLYRRALAISTKTLGTNDPETQTISNDLDELLSRPAK